MKKQLISLLLCSSALYAIPPLMANEFSSSENKLLPLLWESKTFRWVYSDYNEPDWLASQGVNLFKEAANAWESCGLKIEFGGVTHTPVTRRNLVNELGWAKMPLQIRGLTFRIPFPGAQRIAEADLVMNIQNADIQNNPDLLKKVIRHEFGHALGLFHSEFCSDIMSSAAECGRRIADPPPLEPTENDLKQCRMRYQ